MPIDASEILARETCGDDAVTRAALREVRRLRILVVTLCIENNRLRRPTPCEVPAPTDDADETIDVTDTAMLHRNVLGALKMCIKAHGPISFAFVESAAKRIVGAVKVYNNNVRQKQTSQ